MGLADFFRGLDDLAIKTCMKNITGSTQALLKSQAFCSKFSAENLRVLKDQCLNVAFKTYQICK
jgi:hypothetical protein